MEQTEAVAEFSSVLLAILNVKGQLGYGQCFRHTRRPEKCLGFLCTSLQEYWIGCTQLDSER
eukprot:1043945-Amphidinium_carterae.1